MGRSFNRFWKKGNTDTSHIRIGCLCCNAKLCTRNTIEIALNVKFYLNVLWQRMLTNGSERHISPFPWCQVVAINFLTQNLNWFLLIRKLRGKIRDCSLSATSQTQPKSFCQNFHANWLNIKFDVPPNSHGSPPSPTFQCRNGMTDQNDCVWLMIDLHHSFTTHAFFWVFTVPILSGWFAKYFIRIIHFNCWYFRPQKGQLLWSGTYVGSY